MKVVIVLVVACLVALAAGQPTKITPKPRIPCLKECPTKYEPICGGDGKDKPKSFGSVCVMENYNCEKSASLKKISNGECPGGGGVRLS